MSVPYFYRNINSKFLSIEGEDSLNFLQNLITNDINKSSHDNLLYACLLTPQGKFSSDFFIFKKNKKFIIEINSLFYDNFLKKLKIYKLRSKILINKIIDYKSYSVSEEIKKDEKSIIFIADPRNKNIGYKLIHKSSNPTVLKGFKEIDENKYHEILIKKTIPLSHYDLEENKSLLLENNFENLNAISWDKGCYIGQEITARMKYRALLKKKIYTLTLKSGNLNNQQTIKEGGIELGKIISARNNYVLAMIKIEIAENKIQTKKPIKTKDGLILDFIN